MEKKFLCPICKKISNEEVFMIDKYDMLVCPKCQTSFFIEGKSPLGRYKENWKKNAEEIFPLLRPPLRQNDLADLRLFFLYEDCYHTLLIGKYNASIVLMGVLLEALMKERIWLKLGTYFRGAYGDCLEKIEKKRLMDVKDIYFLRKFKDKVRNPYQHADDAQIVKDVGPMEVFPVLIDVSKSVDLQLKQAIENARAGKLKPELISATDPIVRDFVKREYDRKQAVGLFNRVYDFLLDANMKYFGQKEYDEHHKKFGTMPEKGRASQN